MKTVMNERPAPRLPKHNVRVVTATSLFDGHDATINIIRRMLQEFGAEVIHLGHNRSVQDVVKAVNADLTVTGFIRYGL